MNDNAKKLVEAIRLPKTRSSIASRYSLKNLKADQVVKLISAFKPGAVSSANVLASAFGPLVNDFMDSVDLDQSEFSEYLEKLAEIWEDFCTNEIYLHFEELILEEKNQIRDEILHYPLFAKRRILEILRIKNPRLFDHLICIRPLSFYSVSQLWDPNAEESKAVRDYYNTLVRAYLDFNKNNVSAKTYFDFINCLKSPYRALYELSDDFEADYTYGKFRAIFLKQLLVSRTGTVLNLRPEQIQGEAQSSYYMPPPVTVESLSFLSLRWLSEQSYVFKNDLPSRLLEFFLETNPLYYKNLLSDLGKELSSGILKGVEVDLDSEFPEFDQFNLCFKELTKLHAKNVNLKLFESPIHRELLANTRFLAEQNYSDKQKDSKRLEISISYLRGRRLYRPWEIKTLNQEIRSLQREFYQVDLDIKSIEKKTSILSQISTEVYKNYKEDSLPKLIQIADNICSKISLDCYLKTEALADPLILVDVFSFANKKSKIEFIQKEIESLGYFEAKLKHYSETDLIDYLYIYEEIKKGEKLKKLKKDFNDYRVNRVLVEYEHRINKKSFEEIKEREPKLTSIVNLVKLRNDFDSLLSSIAELIVDVSNKIYHESFNLEDKLKDFQNYSTCVAIVWDWVTLQNINPYTTGSAKSQKFQPWLERELALVLKEKDKSCFESLSYLRPASVLGLEPGADFNWKDVDIFQAHISVLVDKFIEISEEYETSEILKIFSAYKGGLSSPFPAFLNTKRYDLDASTDKILLLDEMQKHLFTSRYRRDALNAWVSFHEQAFFGLAPFNGLFFELVMKELKLKHKDTHLVFCLELVKLERSAVSSQRQNAYEELLSEDNEDKDDLLNLISINSEKLDFLEGLRRSLNG